MVQVELQYFFASGNRWDNFISCHAPHSTPEKDPQYLYHTGLSIGKGKVVVLQAWSGPEGSRKLRFPDLMTTAQNGGKVVSPTHRPSLPPGNTPGIHFY